MAAKLTRSVAAAKHDPGNMAKRQRRIVQKGGQPFEPVTESSNGPVDGSAEYIAVLASQLQRIAETNGHGFLAYLIDMVVVEAWRIAGPDADHPDRHGRP